MCIRDSGKSDPQTDFTGPLTDYCCIPQDQQQCSKVDCPQLAPPGETWKNNPEKADAIVDTIHDTNCCVPDAGWEEPPGNGTWVATRDDVKRCLEQFDGGIRDDFKIWGVDNWCKVDDSGADGDLGGRNEVAGGKRLWNNFTKVQLKSFNGWLENNWVDRSKPVPIIGCINYEDGNKNARCLTTQIGNEGVCGLGEEWDHENWACKPCDTGYFSDRQDGTPCELQKQVENFPDQCGMARRQTSTDALRHVGDKDRDTECSPLNAVCDKDQTLFNVDDMMAQCDMERRGPQLTIACTDLARDPDMK